MWGRIRRGCDSSMESQEVVSPPFEKLFIFLPSLLPFHLARIFT
jgi:hypothetical protein